MDKREAAGVRRAITWLHEEARTMTDPHATVVLNNAGFHLGIQLGKWLFQLPTVPDDNTSPAVRKALACYHSLSAVLETKQIADIQVARKVSRSAARAAAEYYEGELAKLQSKEDAHLGLLDDADHEAKYNK